MEFGTWLRKKISFPVRLTVYVRDSYRSKMNNNETFVASFFSPYSGDDYPYIRIDVENHRDEDMNQNEFKQSILTSIAHEIIHYTQWINKLPFCEEEAENESEQLVDAFLEDRIYNLTVTLKEKKLIELAELKSSYENFDEAIELYMKVIEMGCYDEIIYNSIGYCYDCKENYNKSLYYYDKALTLNPNHPIIYMNKGYALYCQNKYNEAIENYNKSLIIEPSKEAYVFKGNAEERLKNYNNAIECYDEAIKLDLEYDVAYNEKGKLLYNMGKYEEAKKACIKAVSLNTDYADAYYNLSLICNKLGETKKLINYLKIAITLDEQYKDYALDDDNVSMHIKSIL